MNSKCQDVILIYSLFGRFLLVENCQWIVAPLNCCLYFYIRL
nr:MAG TPA: hypothetical protein [Caudoviricetes sp.]